jgi:purine nucleoside phosphorylase
MKRPFNTVTRAPDNYCGFAVIAGSGAYSLSFAELGKRLTGKKPLVVDTPFGISSPVHFFQPDSKNYSLALLSRHGETGYLVSACDVNYRANIWALKELGTKRIISWSGPGAIDPAFEPGNFVLPENLIDFTHGRKNTFYQGTGLGFIRQEPVFCPFLRSMLSSSFEALDMQCNHGGIYAVTQGPRLETAAEVRMIERLGGQLVGMTLAPEVFLARELEICYHPCCYVANWAEGVKDLPSRPGKLFDGMLSEKEIKRVALAIKQFPSLILELAANLNNPDKKASKCPCPLAMERYRRSGRIGTDWRTWITCVEP